MRAVNHISGPAAWGDGKPALKRLLCRKCGIPESVAALPFEQLNASQIGALAGAASLLAWAASELECIAPLVVDPTARQLRRPGAPLPTIRPELAETS